jgi:hypothetical protein
MPKQLLTARMEGKRKRKNHGKDELMRLKRI